MAVLAAPSNYTSGQQVTHTNLNAHVNDATFASGAVDNSTTQLSGGAIIVKDSGVTASKLATSAVTTAKIADDAVTDDKIGYPLTAVDINGGAVDGTPIGANSASTGAFTTATCGKVKGSGSTPAIAAGSKLGSGGSVAIVGTDTAGEITISTGSGQLTNGSFADITFATAYATAPYVILYPANEVGTANNIYFNVTATTTGFSFNVGSFTITVVSGKWNYHVIA